MVTAPAALVSTARHHGIGSRAARRASEALLALLPTAGCARAQRARRRARLVPTKSVLPLSDAIASSRLMPEPLCGLDGLGGGVRRQPRRMHAGTRDPREPIQHPGARGEALRTDARRLGRMRSAAAGRRLTCGLRRSRRAGVDPDLAVVTLERDMLVGVGRLQPALAVEVVQVAVVAFHDVVGVGFFMRFQVRRGPLAGGAAEHERCRSAVEELAAALTSVQENQ